MLLLGLFAVAIQSFVVQTHIHIPQYGRAQTVSLFTLVAAAIANSPALAADRNATAPRDKYPINEDPSNCPLCQEFAHSGQFVASAAALVALPVTATVHFIPWAEAAVPSFAITHIWQGRAPPQA
jgi:hypothetical protein